MKIVILDAYTLNPGDLSWDALQQLGELIIYDRTSAEDTVSRCKDAKIVLTNKVIFDQEVISQLPHLQYIGVMATGYNVVDLAFAKQQNIVVTHIPAYSTASVAQFVFSHILHFAQNISQHALSVAQGEWTNCRDFSYRLSPQIELAGKTMGIIGFGKIGQAIARLALAFGMRVIFHNRSVKQSPIEATQQDLETVLRESDFLSINCPLTDENKAFINKSTLAQMKSSAFLINTGRGPLINEQDLADALNNGIIAGAGLDVLCHEPPQADNPLISAKNCAISPHIAWATYEARQRLMGILYDNITAFLAGKAINVVN